jgi:hypothetical protein
MREVQVPKEDFMVGLDYMHKGDTDAIPAECLPQNICRCTMYYCGFRGAILCRPVLRPTVQPFTATSCSSSRCSAPAAVY